MIVIVIHIGNSTIYNIYYDEKFISLNFAILTEMSFIFHSRTSPYSYRSGKHVYHNIKFWIYFNQFKIRQMIKNHHANESQLESYICEGNKSQNSKMHALINYMEKIDINLILAGYKLVYIELLHKGWLQCSWNKISLWENILLELLCGFTSFFCGDKNICDEVIQSDIIMGNRRSNTAAGGFPTNTVKFSYFVYGIKQTFQL